MALRTVTTDPLRRATPLDPGKLPFRKATIDPRTLPPPPLGTATTRPNSGPLALATSHAAASGAPGGVVDPNYRPPVAPPTPPSVVQPPPTAPPVAPRTFEDPRRPSNDPRIQELIRALTGDRAQDGATVARSAELEKLIAQLMRGEGIPTGDMSNDPAAQAFAVTKRREAERMQESEAARVGASGVDGSSELASRAAQIREATGQDIAANNADLTNKRRTEALTTALSGANLSLSDLQRRTLERQGGSQERLALLQVLMGQDKNKFDSYEREKDRVSADRARETQFQREQTERRFQEARQREADRVREEMARLELERKRREAEREKKPVSKGPWRGGFTGF